MGKRLKEDTAKQLTQTDQRHIPYHMVLCSAIKAQGKEEEGRLF